MNYTESMSMSGKPPRCRVLVLGLGGGGGNAVARMVETWNDGPPHLIVDTDADALRSSSVEHTLAIGSTLTQGLSTGGDPHIGRMAAEGDAGLLRDLVRDIDFLFLNVALGGGTGTGVAPVLAQTAKEAGALVVCFATLPFSFEGEGRQRAARTGLRTLRMSADAVVVQENDLLLDTAGKDEALQAAFSEADRILGIGVRALWQLLVNPGMMNLDAAHVRRLVEASGGTCSFGYGEGRGKHKVERALEHLLESPLLERGSRLAKSASLIVSLMAGSDVTLVDIERIMREITSLSLDGAHVMFGVAVDADWHSRLAVTVITAEHYVDVDEPDDVRDDTPRIELPARDGVTKSESRRAVSPKQERRRKLQTRMRYGDPDAGRFKGVEPTVYEGQDFDIPTFIRKGAKLVGDR